MFSWPAFQNDHGAQPASCVVVNGNSFYGCETEYLVDLECVELCIHAWYLLAGEALP